MSGLEGSKTLKNLENAYTGEAETSRRYLAFARKAEQEGYPQVARLFRAAASAETVHACAHLRAMEGIRSTRENLEAAAGGETYEVESMYPPMVEEAKEEGLEQATRSLFNALLVEKIHATLFTSALEKLGRNEETDYWVCQVCGNTVEGEPAGDCPICSAKKSAFEKIG